MSDLGADDQAFVIDSSSLLAYLRGNPGGDLVQRVFQQSTECACRVKTTALSLLETYKTAAAENGPMLDHIISLVSQLPLEVVPLTGDAAAESVRRSLMDEHPQVADCSALELALATEATLVTADQAAAEQYPRCLLVGRNHGGSGETSG